MTFKKIGLHTFTIYNSPAMISTVQLDEDEFETMVMYSDGVELESVTTSTLADAKKAHNNFVVKYNDMIYHGGIAKLLGAENRGQFVKTVIAC